MLQPSNRSWKGHFMPCRLHPYLQKLTPYQARLANIPEILMQTYEEYKCSWERASETTASLPSSLHFGHCIARMANHVVGKLNTILANKQLASGTAPKQWKMLNIVLEKLAGNNNIKKLKFLKYLKWASTITTNG